DPGQVRGRVRRRDLHDAGLGELVDHVQADAGRRGADDHLDALADEVGRRLLGDAGVGRVARVALLQGDVVAEHATGRVDVVDRQPDARDLARAEEGEGAGQGKDGADDERVLRAAAVAASGLRRGGAGREAHAEDSRERETASRRGTSNHFYW